MGFDASTLAPHLVRFDSTDWQARTRFGALIRASNQFGERAAAQVTDVARVAAAKDPGPAREKTGGPDPAGP